MHKLIIYLILLIISALLWQLAPYSGSIAQWPIYGLSVSIGAIAIADATDDALRALRGFLSQSRGGGE